MSAALDALFDTFTHSAYRLETLPAYAVSVEDAAIRAFLDGTARPERSVRTSPWLRRVAVTTAAGKVWARTRVHDTPLTEYQRFQIPAYVESLAAGDATSLIAREATHYDGPDFWLFDDGTDHAHVAVMQYSMGGGFEGFELVTEPGRVAWFVQRRREVDEFAVPLAEFLVSRDVVAHG